MGLHFYVVNVRPSSLQSAVLVDFINHFHVIYFPGTFGFYFYIVGPLLLYVGNDCFKYNCW